LGLDKLTKKRRR